MSFSLLLFACRGFVAPAVDTGQDARLSYCGEAASYYMCRGHELNGQSCVPIDYWKGFYAYYSTCVDYQHQNESCWACMNNHNHMIECPPQGTCDRVCSADAAIIHQQIKNLDLNWYCEE